MGIFKNITKSLKKAAPLIGSTIGFAIGGPAGAAIGSGIGSLAGGRSVEDALLNAGLAFGVGSFAKSAGFGTGTGSGAERLLPSYKGDAAFGFGTSNPVNEFAGLGAGSKPITAIKSAGSESFLSKLIPESTMGKIALGGGILGLAGGLGEEQQTGGFKTPEYAVGQTRLGTGRIGNKLYNLDDPDERRRYFEDNRKRQGAEDIENTPMRRRKGGITDLGGVSGIDQDILEIDRIRPDPNDTRTDVEKMTTGMLKYRTLAGKEGLTEQQLRDIQEEYAKRKAARKSRAPMMSMASVVDPSQLMRTFMAGGEVEGPGTGTSDSVPARLSDGEFVVTAKAVRGAGGGDRDVGAARMYDMMSQLERVA